MTSRTILALALAGALALPALAASPGLISYQTRLENASGPVTSAKDLDFKLFQGGTETSGGTLVYHELAGAVPPTADGVFTWLVGEGTPDTDCTPESPGACTLTPDDFPTDGTEVWLEVTVLPEGDKLLPRTRIATVGYAFQADEANHAATADSATTATDAQLLDGTDSTGFLDTSSTAQTKDGELTLNSDLTLNSSLDVQNGGAAKVRNPNNSSATIQLRWLNDVPNLRYGGSGAGSSAGFQIQSAGDTIRFILDGSNGNVGIGSSPSPSFKLHVQGDIGADDLTVVGHSSYPLCSTANQKGRIGLCGASSREMKDDVAALQLDGLDTVGRLRPVEFTWKADGSPDLGFIAEEVAEVAPLLVHIDADTGEPSAVRYMQMSALLVKAMQEQQQQIETLARRVEALTRQLRGTE